MVILIADNAIASCKENFPYSDPVRVIWIIGIVGVVRVIGILKLVKDRRNKDRLEF